jgi:hypothetical protein
VNYRDQDLEAYRKTIDTEQPFALVVMELTIIGVGGMRGHGAVKKIFELDVAARVIVSSGYAKDPVMADCAEHGFK